MKRFIAIFLSAIIIFAMSKLPVFASPESPMLTSDHVVASTGETVIVNINLEGNPGIISACINVEFDQGLTLIEAKNGNVFPSSIIFTRPKQLSVIGKITESCNFVWSGIDIQDKDIKDGVMLTLVFVVSDEAQNGDNYTIRITSRKNDIVDRNLSCIELEPTIGTVSVVNYVSGFNENEAFENLCANIMKWMCNLIDMLKKIFLIFSKN